jgi:vacuolar protein sorting-associated protein 35
MQPEKQSEDPEETKRQEEAAARCPAEKVKTQKAKARENGIHRSTSSPPTSPSIASEVDAWGKFTISSQWGVGRFVG